MKRTQQRTQKVNSGLAMLNQFRVVNTAFHNAFNKLGYYGLLNLHTWLTKYKSIIILIILIIIREEDPCSEVGVPNPVRTDTRKE